MVLFDTDKEQTVPFTPEWRKNRELRRTEALLKVVGGKHRMQTKVGSTLWKSATLEELLHEDSYLSPVVCNVVAERAVFIRL